MSDKILAIETSNIIGGVALCDGDNLIREVRFQKGMVHAKKLIPSINKILKENKLEPAEIDCIAISIGPGSYTGLRVGLACAKIFSYSLKTKLVAVNSLDILTCNPSADEEIIIPIIDARWNQIYTAFYKNSDNRLKRERISDQMAVTIDELQEKIKQFRKKFLFGDALKRYGSQLQDDDTKFGDEKIWYPRPRYCALLGLEKFRRSEFADVFQIVPLYLRPTEAEVKKGLVK